MLQFNFHLRPQLHQATPYREEGKNFVMDILFQGEK